ncbi:Flagellar biosynthetic protein FliQ [Listeria grayi]|uniref:Bacterial export protein, family 3 n=3 Tax=Listeria grayi TaxID=1641 RepID=D7V0C7_LISGR|nr:flagellar biosynthetic protein FliQ [Listeria grayi]EFI83020.1 bacterial export protein, family 3 [Listeria grayi DSM 20601]STY43978.1 Flagellar biosynthetic protein FliQ [Listeria grayi]VEI35512.1 Flagellar biosynthetic protein FliQ [Listeria grayi]
MNLTPVMEVFQKFFYSGLTIILPVSIVCLVVVILVAIIMAMMQIQDQSLTFLPKIIAFVVALFILGPWMFGHMTDLIVSIFAKIPTMIQV